MGTRAFRSFVWMITRLLAGVAALAAISYATLGAFTWLRYGRHSRPSDEERDAALDEFIPRYDVVERHHIDVAASPAVVMAEAREMDLAKSPVVRAIFRARELVMGAGAQPRKARGLVDETVALGWGILRDDPGREIVVGAVTRPWEADVKFVALPPDRFAAFDEPGFVKIVWTLRADPVGPSSAIFRTETRAVATDATARARFRRYWALASPGIWLIPRLTLEPLRAAAEDRARRFAVASGS
jgi:hypothetical protein